MDEVLTPYEDDPLEVLLLKAMNGGEARQIIARLYRVAEVREQRLGELEMIIDGFMARE